MLVELALADHVVERLEGQVGIDGAGAVADQQGEVMHLARLAALEDQADLGARAFADQVMMHAGDRQQRRDRRVVAVDAAVGQDDEVVARRRWPRWPAGTAPSAPAPGPPRPP